MPRMLYINCSGPTSRSRSLSMRRLLPRSRKEKEEGEGTFVGHGRSDSDSGRTHAGRGSGNRVPGNSGKVKVCDSSASCSSRPRLYTHVERDLAERSTTMRGRNEGNSLASIPISLVIVVSIRCKKENRVF